MRRITSLSPAKRSAAFRSFLTFLAIASVGPEQATASEHWNLAVSSITHEDLLRHVSFLASDSLEGREAGSRGGHAAVAYIVDRLKTFGVEPLGEDGSYIQEFSAGYRNVIGVIRGSDPVLRQEYILVGGHLDHVGYGTRLNSSGGVGRIHNGADDNASGVSAVLEIAQALTTLPEPLPRSVIVAFWDGEEKGLLGSRHWMRLPTVKPDSLRLAINVDMIGRLQNESLTVYGSRTCRGLRQRVMRGNEASRLKVQFDLSHRDDSDHYSFYEKKIPYLMLFTGDHPDYHRPTDDVDRINFEGLEAIARLVLKVVGETAEDSALAGFRDECRDERASGGIVLTQSPPRLGIRWQEARGAGEPFVIVQVDEGSPAQRAGLQAGDRMVRFGGRTASEIDDLRALVTNWNGPAEAVVEREDALEPISLTIKLGGCCCPAGAELRMDPADIKTVYVTRVASGSPAEREGFRAGDRIVLPDYDAPSSPIPREEAAAWTVEREGRMHRLTID